jgi:broad specificity phosphatase PhoE
LFLSRIAAWLSAIRLAFSRQPSRPALVLVIRHGEKSGKKNDIHLNARGYERANALHGLFPNRFPAPEFLFATKASDNSNRPVETITPLSKALGLPIQSQFANNQFTELAHELLNNPVYAGKIVLVCWHHGKIPGFTVNLGVRDTLPEWTEDLYDRVWRIEYKDGSVLFANLPQQLLPGDSTE